jgi:hypothetical protein
MVDMEMKMLSDVQFLHLPRYPNGRVRDLPGVFHALTEDQVNMLHGDDWTYYLELKEEIEWMMKECA